MKLSQAITQYVELKQSMGSRFHTEAVILKAFSKAMQDVELDRVQPGCVMNYLHGVGPVTSFWHRKHSALRGFYRFALGRGYTTRYPLPTDLPKVAHPFVPYAFSTDEIRRLVAAAGQMTSRRTKLEPETISTILLLLYGAGLRISEALNLTFKDVDLEEGLLKIERSKFYKSRLVPIGERLTGVMLSYVHWGEGKRTGRDDHDGQGGDRPFFITRSGDLVSRAQVENAFSRIRDLANIQRTDGGRFGPRLHDLRHASAIHRVEAWYRDGADVQRLLPLLSTYLGHVNVAATQHYLTMTPELLREAGLRFERYARPREVQDE